MHGTAPEERGSTIRLESPCYSARMAWQIPPINHSIPGQLFRHAQLESVKAWLGDPAHQALPRHVRIQRAIRQLILDGALDAGRPLPASRALARSLGVSRDTVEAAYGQLHAEGFIEASSRQRQFCLGAGAAAVTAAAFGAHRAAGSGAQPAR